MPRYKTWTTKGGQTNKISWSAIRVINRRVSEKKKKAIKENLPEDINNDPRNITTDLTDSELAEVAGVLENINALNQELDAVEQSRASKRQVEEPQPGPSGYNLRKRRGVDTTQDMEVEEIPAGSSTGAGTKSGAIRSGGHGGGGAGSSSQSDSGNFFLWKSVTQVKSSDIHFKNTHLFFTWGYGYKWFDVNAKNVTTVGARRLVTSGAQWMSNHLSQFMSPAQFESLPPFAYVKDIEIYLTVVGLEASFSTLSTLSGSASITHVPFLIYNKGGNLALCHETVTVNNDSKNPMEIAGIDVRSTKIGTIMWGETANNTHSSSQTVPRNWPNYDSWIIPTDSKSGDSKNVFGGTAFGSPMLNSIYHQGIASRAVDSSEVFHWSYKPRIGLIKNVSRAHGFMLQNDEYMTSSNVLPSRIQLIQDDNDTINMRSDSPVKPTSFKKIRDLFVYDQAIEKGFLMGKLNEFHSAPLMPSFTLGINPVPNNAPTDTNSFVNCKLIVQMTTNIVIGTNYETYHNQVQTLSHADELYVLNTVDDMKKSFFFTGVTFDSNAVVGSNVSAKLMKENTSKKYVTVAEPGDVLRKAVNEQESRRKKERKQDRSRSRSPYKSTLEIVGEDR